MIIIITAQQKEEQVIRLIRLFDSVMHVMLHALPEITAVATELHMIAQANRLTPSGSDTLGVTCCQSVMCHACMRSCVSCWRLSEDPLGIDPLTGHDVHEEYKAKERRPVDVLLLLY